MRGFHGKGKRQAYFEGWYVKQQNEAETVAFIPAFHIDPAGKASASLQIITDTGQHHLDIPASQFCAKRDRLEMRIGGCVFSELGCELHLNEPNCALSGQLQFGAFTPPAADIMGPFRFVPLMECRHSVFSLFHRVDGQISLNGREMVFSNGTGYMEGDRGKSFPKRYIWTQCGWDGNCVMLSVADIPFGGASFTGCAGLVYLNGKQRRIATYLGARVLRVDDQTAVVRQGPLTLTATLLQTRPHLLRAPDAGGMTRLIRESASCQIEYRCMAGDEVLFHFISDRGSFESNWEAPPAVKA